MKTIILFQPMTQEAPYEPIIPWSIIYAAVYLFNDPRFNLVLIDQNLERNSWKKRVETNLNQDLLCVGISSLTGSTIYYGLEFSQIIKQNCPDVPVIWGGVHATALPEQTLRNKYIDIVVRFEGELTFRDLAYALYDRKRYTSIKGLSYKIENQIFHNPDRDFVNLNTLPDLPFAQIDLRKYVYQQPITEKQSLSTMQFFVSRGCPQECTFCYNTMFHKRKYRVMNPQKIVNTIKLFLKEAEKQGVKCDHIWFPDDHLFVSEKQISSIIDLFKEQGIKLKWSAYLHMKVIDKFSDAFIEHLIAHGLIKLHCGIESGSERILKLIKKNISIALVEKVNKRLMKFKIPIKYSFMGGFPKETVEELGKTVKLMLKLTRDNSFAETTRISIFSPYPGTALYDTVTMLGFTAPQKLEDWTGLNKFLILHHPWLDKKMKITLQIASLISFFFDRSKYRSSGLRRIVFILYRPIARFRAYFNLYMPFLDTYLLHRFQQYRLHIK